MRRRDQGAQHDWRVVAKVHCSNVYSGPPAVQSRPRQAVRRGEIEARWVSSRGIRRRSRNLLGRAEKEGCEQTNETSDPRRWGVADQAGRVLDVIDVQTVCIVIDHAVQEILTIAVAKAGENRGTAQRPSRPIEFRDERPVESVPAGVFFDNLYYLTIQ